MTNDDLARQAGGVSRYFKSADGLNLHIRDYRRPDLRDDRPPDSLAAPVVCLPGLARTGDDFFRLAERLSGNGRRVLAFDCRGRGKSDWDGDWRGYAIPVECDDIRTGLADAGVERAHFVGTSRGGLQIMALAASAPNLILSAVFNDIGPVIESAGLEAIRSYVGRLPVFASFAQAAEAFQRQFGASFPALEAGDWDIYARLTFEERDGGLRLRYDPRLAQTLAPGEAERAPVWPLFEALANRPILVLRGENSLLLAPSTVEEMRRRHPGCEALSVPGQGHAPMLLDAATLEAVIDFIARADRSRADAPD